jgi:hypothetical protein
MLEFRTQGFNGYGIKYSPFFDSRIAVASSANFGLVGNGRLYILGLTPNGIVAEKWCAQRRLSTQQRAPPDGTTGSTHRTPSSTRPGPKHTNRRS